MNNNELTVEEVTEKRNILTKIVTEDEERLRQFDEDYSSSEARYARKNYLKHNEQLTNFNAGQRIHDMRVEMGASREEVAEYLGADIGVINTIETELFSSH